MGCLSSVGLSIELEGLKFEELVIVQVVKGPIVMGLRHFAQFAEKLVEIKLVGFKAAVELII